MLLFVTNYFAILLTGSFVFGLMGYPKAALQGSTPRIKRAAIAIVVVMVVVIMVPLGLSSLKVLTRNAAEGRVAEATKNWLEGSDYRFISAAAADDRVNVVVAGSGELPPDATLVTSLKGRLYGLAVHVEAVPSTSIDFATK